VVATFFATVTSADELSRLRAWRKKGPVGKLHLLIIYIKHSNNRRVFFESKQCEPAGEACKLYQVALNGGVR